MAVRSFMPMRVVHGLTVEWSAMLYRVCSTLGVRSVIPLPVIEVMVDMAIETRRAMKPRAGTDEYAA